MFSRNPSTRFKAIGKGTNQIHGDTVIVAETGKKIPVWSVSISCARTPLIVQIPDAASVGTAWFAATPFCQFNTTAARLLPGLMKRTSKNVCGVRLEPETVTEKVVPATTLVFSTRNPVTT